MLMAKQGRRYREGRATYSSDVSVELIVSASESAAEPASPIWLLSRLQQKMECQGCSWRDRAPAQRRARATYLSDVSVALILSASESAAAPTSPISSPSRLQRGEEGQGCSWRDTKAQSRACATYSSDVSKINAFAS